MYSREKLTRQKCRDTETEGAYFNRLKQVLRFLFAVQAKRMCGQVSRNSYIT